MGVAPYVALIKYWRRNMTVYRSISLQFLDGLKAPQKRPSVGRGALNR
jgi:hypothetical protein